MFYIYKLFLRFFIHDAPPFKNFILDKITQKIGIYQGYLYFIYMGLHVYFYMIKSSCITFNTLL